MLFSDGKYVISTEYGGWLPDFLPPEQVLDYIEQADGILQHFGAPAERFMPNNELKKKNAWSMTCIWRRPSSSIWERTPISRPCEKMAAFLKEHVTILTDTDVTDVDKAAHTVHYEGKGVQDSVTAEHIIFAVGRVGSRFFLPNGVLKTVFR